MEDEERSKGIQNFEVLDFLVLEFGMDHIENIKVKDLKVLICYYSGS